jgi:hypothetical protein
MSEQDAKRQQTLIEAASSEVARILEQIRMEYEAAMQGLSGLSQGGTRHSFITTKMEHMGELQFELEKLIGDESIALVANALENMPTNAGTASPG